MKTITIDDNGKVKIIGELTDKETVAIGEAIFGDFETDNDKQLLFYTGIYFDEIE